MRYRPPRPGPRPDPAPVPPPDPTPKPVPPPVPPGPVIEVTPSTLTRADVARPGDSVLFHAGTYPGIVLRSGVQYLAAPGEPPPVLDGSGGGKIGLTGNGIRDVLIHGLTVRNFHNLSGIQDGSHITLEGCVFSDGGTTGPWFSASSDCSVIRCVIARCGNMQTHGDNALAFEGSSRILVDSCDISAGVHAAIQALHCPDMTIKHCNLHGNFGSSIIAKRQCDRLQILQNRISHGALSTESAEGRRDAAIQVVGDDAHVVGNWIDNCGSGIYLSIGEPGQSCNRALVELNTVLSVEEASLDFGGYAAAGIGRLDGAVIRKNIFSGAGRATIRLQMRGGRKWWGATFTENTCWGGPVQVMEGDAPTVDMADPQIDMATLRSKAFPARGYQGA